MSLAPGVVEVIMGVPLLMGSEEEVESLLTRAFYGLLLGFSLASNRTE
jgi:hypothetical protein